jgi:hypothetical protein
LFAITVNDIWRCPIWVGSDVFSPKSRSGHVKRLKDAFLDKGFVTFARCDLNGATEQQVTFVQVEEPFARLCHSPVLRIAHEGFQIVNGSDGQPRRIFADDMADEGFRRKRVPGCPTNELKGVAT